MNDFNVKLKPLLSLLSGGGGGSGLITGGGASGTGMQASGGIISDYTDPGPGDNYRAHIFTSSGTFVVSALSQGIENGDNIEYLVVAGGGAGGGIAAQSGGGGAGGFRTNLTGHPVAAPTYTVSAGTYTVTVGAGGEGGAWGGPTPIQAYGNQGGNSEFYPTPVSYPSTERIRSVGGGGGVGYNVDPGPIMNGGSGGGAMDTSSVKAGGTGNTPDPNHPQVQGYDGGPTGPTYTSPYAGGGGGGAGRVGAPDDPSTPLGRSTGGYGHQALIAGPPASPQTIGAPGPGTGAAATGYFAGGGGGGGYGATGAVGGYGGGAQGGGGVGQMDGFHAAPATGGGGGGSGYNGGYGVGGKGGSGVVVVRYKIGSAELGGSKATGGSISFTPSKTIHTFVGSGDFTVTNGPISAEALVVGGGGGGGSHVAGGGGAGGVVYHTNLTFADSTPYTITVGAGGRGGYRGNPNDGSVLKSGADGGVSSIVGTPITSLIANGGGGGGAYNTPSAAGRPGGSGGGGAGQSPAAGGNTVSPPSTGPSPGSTHYGNGGGAAVPTNPHCGGGGGGAGGAGQAGTPTDGGDGGEGIGTPTVPWLPSQITSLSPDSKIAGGGGGNAYAGGSGAESARGLGKGGGGNGAYGSASTPASTPLGPYARDGIENTGGGGGGQSYNQPGSPLSYFDGGTGGSGVVLIAYPT